DIDNTVFSYIPNTASVAFRGMVQELEVHCRDVKKERIRAAGNSLTAEEFDAIFATQLRIEEIAVKDMKLRTFITQDKQRNDLVTHIYDVTYGVVRRDKDTLVVLDDSIVRGTTLRNSIIRILDRLGPKNIVIASSAPQIRYPDCYGIDMAKLSDFIAFRATIALLNETRQSHIINEVYKKCKQQEKLPKEQMLNYVKEIYKPFTAKQISDRIAAMITSTEIKARVSVVYQSIENLHAAIPDHKGDWYFTGDYPTPGGNKVVNRSFINFIEGRNERAY
ncbi:MAG: amidophosphoribosyltransferase, partial [Bacteroidales bacterium]|nr:amidophosphoribosyltransferase [Bacteroidales bacterium]